LGLVNNFGAIKGVTAVITRFSSEILTPQVAGDFKGNEYHADLERIRTEQIPLQLNDDKGTSKQAIKCRKVTKNHAKKHKNGLNRRNLA
jgi:hypothetical protein